MKILGLKISMVFVNENSGKFVRYTSNLVKFIRDTWASASAISISAIILHDLISIKSLSIVLAIALGYSYAYIINDYFDATNDQANPNKAKRNLFVSKSLSLTLVSILNIAIISILFLIFIQFSNLGIVIFSISIIIPWLYSAKPFRFKSRPGLDLITHGIFVSSYPYFITLVLLKVNFLIIDYIILFLTILLSLTVQLENQIRDFEYDAQNDFNFTILVGRRNSIYLMKFLTIIVILFGFSIMIFQLVPFFLYPALILLLPWLIHRLIREFDQPRSEKLVKFTTYSELLYLVILIVYFKTQNLKLVIF